MINGLHFLTGGNKISFKKAIFAYEIFRVQFILACCLAQCLTFIDRTNGITIKNCYCNNGNRERKII
jgi:hypothetical protein